MSIITELEDYCDKQYNDARLRWKQVYDIGGPDYEKKMKRQEFLQTKWMRRKRLVRVKIRFQNKLLEFLTK